MKAEGRDGRARECPEDGMAEGQGNMARGRFETSGRRQMEMAGVFLPYLRPGSEENLNVRTS